MDGIERVFLKEGGESFVVFFLVIFLLYLFIVLFLLFFFVIKVYGGMMNFGGFFEVIYVLSVWDGFGLFSVFKYCWRKMIFIIESVRMKIKIFNLMDVVIGGGEFIFFVFSCLFVRKKYV